MLVSEIMTKNIVTIESDNIVLDECKRYNRYRIGCPIVMKDGAMARIVTERDVISRVVIRQKDPYETKVEEIMSKDVTTVHMQQASKKQLK